MQFIIRTLKGEFGLLKTFWLGLILCGALISVISHNLEDYVWFAYHSQDEVIAAIMQWAIIALELLLIAIAVSVIFASFYDRKPNYKGWLASIIAAIIIASSVATIIETTTSIRNKGQSYGWPMGRDHRSFGRFGQFHFMVDRLMNNAVIHELQFTITTIHSPDDAPYDSQDDNSLPAGIEMLNEDEAREICRHLFFIHHPSIKGLTITTTNEDGQKRGLHLAQEDCRR